MLNNYLTDWEAVENIDLIKKTALQVWGENIEFGEIKGSNSPYPEFEWQIYLYSKFSIKLDYDRSTLSIGVPTKDGYVVLSSLANELVFGGFDGMKPENLLHNFQVLDRLIQTQKID